MTVGVTRDRGSPSHGGGRRPRLPGPRESIPSGRRMNVSLVRSQTPDTGPGRGLSPAQTIRESQGLSFEVHAGAGEHRDQAAVTHDGSCA